MRLDDPFGRVARNNHQAYTALRMRLLAEGVNDTAAVDRFTRNMRRTAGRLTLLVLALSAMLGLLFPRAAAPLFVFGAVVIAWLGTSYWQTRAHVHRYRRELADRDAGPALAPEAPGAAQSDHPRQEERPS